MCLVILLKVEVKLAADWIQFTMDVHEEFKDKICIISNFTCFSVNAPDFEWLIIKINISGSLSTLAS